MPDARISPTLAANPSTAFSVSDGVSDTTVGIGSVLLDRDQGNATFQATAYQTSANQGIGTTLYRKARGTLTAPLRAKANDLTGRLAGNGAFAADDVSAASFPGAGRARLDFLAEEDQTSTGQGHRIDFYTTAVGTTAPALALRLSGSGLAVWGANTGVDDSIGVATTPRWAQVLQGSTATPDTTLEPLLKVTRTTNVTHAAITGDGAEQLASIIGIGVGAVTTQTQPVGVFGGAKSSSTDNSVSSPDACGLYGFGRITGSGVGVGMGAFVTGRRDTNTGKASALQVQCGNYTATPGTYNTTGFPDTSAIWIWAQGNANSGVAIAVGNPFGFQFDVGLGFNGQVSTVTGGIVTASISDDSASVVTLRVNGSHTNAIDTTNATLSGAAIKLGEGHNVQTGTVTGTKIGTATGQKIGFWNVAPVAQYATTGTTTGFAAGTGTAVLSASTFTGNTGATAYTIGDVVRALKLCGIMAA